MPAFRKNSAEVEEQMHVVLGCALVALASGPKSKKALCEEIRCQQTYFYNLLQRAYRRKLKKYSSITSRVIDGKRLYCLASKPHNSFGGKIHRYLTRHASASQIDLLAICNFQDSPTGRARLRGEIKFINKSKVNGKNKIVTKNGRYFLQHTMDLIESAKNKIGQHNLKRA